MQVFMCVQCDKICNRSIKYKEICVVFKYISVR